MRGKNDNLNASTEGWQKADVEAVLFKDGAVTLEVSAPADKGFMILKSKGTMK